MATIFSLPYKEDGECCESCDNSWPCGCGEGWCNQIYTTLCGGPPTYDPDSECICDPWELFDSYCFSDTNPPDPDGCQEYVSYEPPPSYRYWIGFNSTCNFTNCTIGESCYFEEELEPPSIGTAGNHTCCATWLYCAGDPEPVYIESTFLFFGCDGVWNSIGGDPECWVAQVIYYTCDPNCFNLNGGDPYGYTDLQINAFIAPYPVPLPP